VRNPRVVLVASLVATLFVVQGKAQGRETASAPKPLFTWREVMIPVRDGVHLQTVLLVPAEQKEALPILFPRTPYGVPVEAPTEMPASWKEQMADCNKADTGNTRLTSLEHKTGRRVSKGESRYP
jgi:predicted acyl esterase